MKIIDLEECSVGWMGFLWGRLEMKFLVWFELALYAVLIEGIVVKLFYGLDRQSVEHGP